MPRALAEMAPPLAPLNPAHASRPVVLALTRMGSPAPPGKLSLSNEKLVVMPVSFSGRMAETCQQSAKAEHTPGLR